MKVDFIIAGAMKSGTTSLHHLLQSHPEVVMAKPKEPQFFSNHLDWRKRIGQYHKYFDKRPGVIYGEASTNYTKYPYVKNLELVQAIREYNPEMKIIYMIRHPVDRVLSQYMHIFQSGYTGLSIERALRGRPQLLMNSRYYMQISRFLDVFKREQIMLIKFEDFIRDQSVYLRRVAGFLQIEEERFSMEEIQSNPSEKGKFVDHRIERFFHGNLWIKDVLPEGLIKKTRRILAKMNPRDLPEKPALSKTLQEVILRITSLDIRKMEDEFGLELSDYHEIRERHLPDGSH